MAPVKRPAAAAASKAKSSWATSDGIGDRQGVWGISGTAGQLLADLGTVFLLIATPPISIYMYQIMNRFNGSVVAFAQYAYANGPWAVAAMVPVPTWDAWLHLGAFAALQTALLLGVPSKKFKATVTPKGHVPEYPANGVESYLLTFAILGALWRFGIFDPGHVYDIFGEIIVCLNIGAYLLCAFLLVKGYVAPSSSDSGTTGRLLYDFYWGTELHPQLSKYLYIKQWTNCRIGMMGWGVLIVCYAVKSYQLHGALDLGMLVSVALQHVYIAKFFLWEMGYMCSMDIQHDRAGFMICWGCLCWVTGVYTSPSMYLTLSPSWQSPATAAANFLFGVVMVLLNYDADRQRQEFRRHNGDLKIWGRPAVAITATYRTSSGETRKSLLLASGWWGVARHWHYVPEILAALAWSLPAGTSALLPYFYVVFLCMLLTDRGFKDDEKCAAKYGAFWKEYCRLVPYKMIPGVL